MNEPEKVQIVNLSDLEKALHKCASQDVLTEIRLNVVNISASFQEQNARFEEHMAQNLKDMEDLKEILKAYQKDMEDVKHNCRFPEDWTLVWQKFSILERFMYEQSGSSVWTNRIVNIGQAIMVAVAVALALFFMKGGAIT